MQISLEKLIILLISVTVFFSCVRNEIARNKGSQDLLKEGLSYIDEGKTEKAEESLRKSVEADPSNSRAREALSSLYASQVGINLSNMSDSILKASDLLSESKLTQLEKQSAEYLATFLSKLTPSENEVDKKLKELQELTKKISEVLSGTRFLTTIFFVVPELTDEQLVILDKAISILRDGAIAPQDREEGNRMYLAFLGSIRVVNYLKRAAGEVTFSVDSFVAHLCKSDPEPMRTIVSELKQSLVYMEEGLVISPTDPQTSHRKRRQRLQGFVTTLLEKDAWLSIDSLFTEDSLTRNFIQEYSKEICKPQ